MFEVCGFNNFFFLIKILKNVFKNCIINLKKSDFEYNYIFF